MKNPTFVGMLQARRAAVPMAKIKPIENGIMDYQHFVEYFLVGSAGAAAAELIKLYELRGKWSSVKFKSAVRSPLFWAIVAGMLAASGFIAWSANAASVVAPWQLVLSGVGARALIRAPAELSAANQRMRLGSKDPRNAFKPLDIFD